MTGQGQAQTQYEAAHISSEVRTVNNRHLKIQTRCSEGLSSLEPKIESVVKSSLRRGSVQLNVQVSGTDSSSDYQLEQSVLESYIRQCEEIQSTADATPVRLADLLTLPGVVSEQRVQRELAAELSEAILKTVERSLAELNQMRQAEGQSMGLELERQLNQMLELTSSVEERAPHVVEEYRARLKAKLETALADAGGTISDTDVIREVLLLADKVDIREEIVRLRSHFEQFASLLGDQESQGRKLDFLIQEMFRETNTIGSKANDAEIAQRVVDMKSVLEQMRELVQNVE